MATLEDLMINIGVDTDDAEKGASRVKDLFESNFAKITAAGVAAGAGMEAFARSQQDTNATLERAAIASDETADSLRAMALEMSDHTFAASDAAAGMEQLAQMGFNTGEQFEAILPVMDSMSDATGRALPDSIKTADKLLRPFGQSLDDVGENADRMTNLIAQTDIPLGTLERNLGRVPDELQALQFGLDDAAVGIDVFRERGFSGQEAVREFRRAVADSEGDMSTFLENIELTADEWQHYSSQLAPVEGLTNQLADANNDQMTVMQRLGANLDNLRFKFGGLASVAGTIAPMLIAMGPAAKGVALAYGLLTGNVARATVAFIAKTAALVAGKVAIAAVTVAQWLWNAATLANPIGLIILAIIALIAIVVLLVKNFDTVKKVAAAVWGWIWDKLKAFASWFMRTFWESGLKRVINLVRSHFQFMRDLIGKVFSKIKSDISTAISWFRSLPGRIKSAIMSIRDIIPAPFKAAFNAISRLWNATAGRLSFTAPSWVPGIGGKGFSLPKLPMLADGGTLRVGGAAIVGEAGPEMVDMPRGARVTPLGQGGSRLTVDIRGAESEFKEFFRRWIANDRTVVT